MNVLLLSLTTFISPIAGTIVYEPKEPRVEVEVQYTTLGLANYVSVRCGWSGPDDVTDAQLAVLGPGPANRILGVIDSTGPSIQVQDAPRLTLDGTVDCSVKGSGCKSGDTISGRLVWSGYDVTTWSGPVFEKFGCEVSGHYKGEHFKSGKLATYRMREDNEHEVIDARITHDDMHFRLRSGLNSKGTIKYMHMRCAAFLIVGLEVKSIEIFKPDGSLLSGVYIQGNHTHSEGDRAVVSVQMDCTANNKGCYRNEKAYMGLLWRKMDLDRDIGNQSEQDFYRLTCKIYTATGHDTATYTQYRSVRVSGGVLE